MMNPPFFFHHTTPNMTTICHITKALIIVYKVVQKKGDFVYKHGRLPELPYG